MKMTARSQSCHIPVDDQMNRYPAGTYPFLFPSVISGLPLPPLQRLQGHPPTSGCSTPSPASQEESGAYRRMA
uniref:Uncharacterized protein n=1 Tax=Lepisosteus oculatus TaxID=7918 RepID=W5MIV3_LEPOC